MGMGAPVFPLRATVNDGGVGWGYGWYIILGEGFRCRGNPTSENPVARAVARCSLGEEGLEDVESLVLRRVLQAGLGEVLAVVLAVLVDHRVPAALHVGDVVVQVLGHRLAPNVVLVVLHARVADQVLHVAHVGAGVVVRVALGHRADVGRAAISVILEVEGDHVGVTVVTGAALDLHEVVVGGEHLVVALVVGVSPAVLALGASHHLSRDLFARVGELGGHLGHGVLCGAGVGALALLHEGVVAVVAGGSQDHLLEANGLELILVHVFLRRREARVGEVLALVLAVRAVAAVASALKVLDGRVELGVDRLARLALRVGGVLVTEQVLHVAHVGARVVVRVSLGHRARVGRAPGAVVGQGEGDHVGVLVVARTALQLDFVVLRGNHLVVAAVVRVRPAVVALNTGFDLSRNRLAAVLEVNGHLGHRVLSRAGGGAGGHELEVVVPLVPGAAQDHLRGGCLQGLVLQAGVNKVLAVVLAVRVVVPVATALLVGGVVGQVAGQRLAAYAVLVVLGVGVAEQVLHVAKVGARVVVRVALGHRADVRLAAGSIGGKGEGDHICVLVVSRTALDLDVVSVGGEELVVSAVVGVAPALVSIGTSLHFLRDRIAVVVEGDGHLGHGVLGGAGAGAGREELEVIVPVVPRGSKNDFFAFAEVVVVNESRKTVDGVAGISESKGGQSKRSESKTHVQAVEKVKYKCATEVF